jgi:hypothetical protein
MTPRFLVAVLVSIAALAGCGADPKYRVRVDSPMTPFKPADPDDLVIDSDDADEEDTAARPGGDEE